MSSKNEIYKLSPLGKKALRKISTSSTLSDVWREVLRNRTVEVFSDHLRKTETKISLKPGYMPYFGQIVDFKIPNKEIIYPIDVHAYRPQLRKGAKSTLLMADLHVGGAPEKSFTTFQNFDQFFNGPKNISHSGFHYKFIIGAVANPFQNDVWMQKYLVTKSGAHKPLNFHIPLNSNLDSLIGRIADNDLLPAERHLAKSPCFKNLTTLREQGKFLELGKKFAKPIFRSMPWIAGALTVGTLALAGTQMVKASAIYGWKDRRTKDAAKDFGTEVLRASLPGEAAYQAIQTDMGSKAFSALKNKVA